MNIIIKVLGFLSFTVVALALEHAGQNYTNTAIGLIYQASPKNKAELDTFLAEDTHDEWFHKMARIIFADIDTGPNEPTEVLSEFEIDHFLGHQFEWFVLGADSNDDGFLEIADFEKTKVTFFDPIFEEVFTWEKFMPIPETKFSLTPMIEKMDANMDGQLSKEEVQNFFRDVLKKIDANHDDLIDSGELTKAMEDMGIKNPNMAIKPITKAKEMGIQLWNAFSKDLVDTNGDGKLTLAELQAALLLPLTMFEERLKTPEVMEVLGQHDQAIEALNQKLDTLGFASFFKKEKLSPKVDEWFLASGSVPMMTISGAVPMMRISGAVSGVIIIMACHSLGLQGWL